jgi:ribonucleotide reductase alpha subunit
MNDSMSAFATNVMNDRYAHDIGDRKETWAEIAERSVTHVFGAVGLSPSDPIVHDCIIAVKQRKFMPGGRYLYSTGFKFHQTQNCVLMRVEDTRQGWGALKRKVMEASMTGAGLGVYYGDLREADAVLHSGGGTSSGPIPLMESVNGDARAARQGGKRRGAIWAGLPWSHPDVFKFIHAKDWSEEIIALKARDFNFPAPLDMTNISVCLNNEFFDAYHRPQHPKHSLAQRVYWEVIEGMCRSGEPGFSVDIDGNSREVLRNAPVCAETRVLTDNGYTQAGLLANKRTTVWTGKRWAKNVVFKKTGTNVNTVRVSMTGGRSISCDPTHPFLVERWIGAGRMRRLACIDRVPAKDLIKGDYLHVSLPSASTGDAQHCRDMYQLGFLFGDGHFRSNSQAEVTFCTQEKLLCFDRFNKRTVTSVGADGRGYVRAYIASDFAGMDKSRVPDCVFRADADNRAAFLAGLFDADGNFEPVQVRIRLSSVHKGFLGDVARLLESLGILANVSKGGPSGYGGRNSFQLVVASDFNTKFMDLIPTCRVRADTRDYTAYRASKIKVIAVEPGQKADVYCADVGVEEHSFMAEGVIISNCTEITSEDPDDICNLGSINLARVTSVAEMYHLVRLGTAFLLAGTVYSDVPYPEVTATRAKNRRLGLGLMGIHEWLLLRGKKYGPDHELAELLHEYTFSDHHALAWAKAWNLSTPIKTRAIAPNGTIGIVAETTTGCEPIFCAAYKRRYRDGETWKYSYVLDPTAKRLVDMGADPSSIEDAYTISVADRINMQVWLQGFVDHAISSTINMPAWGSEKNNASTLRSFGDLLMENLPSLRGITVYPDGARGGQPLSYVPYAEAMQYEGKTFVESADVCDLTRGGGCG